MKNKLRDRIKAFLAETVTVNEIVKRAFPNKAVIIDKFPSEELKEAFSSFTAERRAVAEELLLEVLKSTEEYVPSSEDITELRKDFERSLSKGRFHRNPDGSYRDKYTARLWLGFQLYHNKIVMEGTNTQRTFKVEGRWIIGGLMENGYPRMSPTPHVHLNRDQAITEGHRLADEHGRSFALYRCHEVITPTSKGDA